MICLVVLLLSLCLWWELWNYGQCSISQIAPDENFIISGFLNVNGGSSSGIPSNLGILDQIAALHWIQENIQDFGGQYAVVLSAENKQRAGGVQ